MRAMGGVEVILGALRNFAVGVNRRRDVDVVCI
jgi:hypothetical protein